MKHYALPHTLGASLVEYLKKRPYDEVAQFIQALDALPTVNLSPPPKPEPDEGEPKH